MQPLSRRLGPKRSMIVLVLLFGAGLGLFGLIRPDAPGGAHDARNLWLAFAGITIAGIPITGLDARPVPRPSPVGGR